MRNPRRAYNPDGSEIQPATVGGERAKGQTRAEIWCNQCHHHGEVSTNGMPEDLAVPDICLRYHCSSCGSKALTSRMSIREFYEIMEAKTGMSHGVGKPIRRGTEPDEQG